MLDIVDVTALNDQETKDLLLKIAKEANDGDVYVEIGAFVGGSITYISQLFKRFNKDVQVYTIDNWLCENVDTSTRNYFNIHDRFFDRFEENLKKTGVDDIVNYIFGDSFEVVKAFPDDYINHLFLDGSHVYEDVVKELEIWIPKVKMGGIIYGHDFSSTPFDVRRAVLDTLGEVEATPNKICYYWKKL